MFLAMYPLGVGAAIMAGAPLGWKTHSLEIVFVGSWFCSAAAFAGSAVYVAAVRRWRFADLLFWLPPGVACGYLAVTIGCAYLLGMDEDGALDVVTLLLSMTLAATLANRVFCWILARRCRSSREIGFPVVGPKEADDVRSEGWREERMPEESKQ
jgi:hypothetical protein